MNGRREGADLDRYLGVDAPALHDVQEGAYVPGGVWLTSMRHSTRRYWSPRDLIFTLTLTVICLLFTLQTN